MQIGGVWLAAALDDGVVAPVVIGPVPVELVLADLVPLVVPAIFVLPALVPVADPVLALLEPDGPQALAWRFRLLVPPAAI